MRHLLVLVVVVAACGVSTDAEPTTPVATEPSCVEMWDRLLIRWDATSAHDRLLAGFDPAEEMFELRRLPHFRLWAQDNGHPDRCWSGDDIVGAYKTH